MVSEILALFGIRACHHCHTAPATLCDLCAAGRAASFIRVSRAALCVDCDAIFDGEVSGSCPRCGARYGIGCVSTILGDGKTILGDGKGQRLNRWRTVQLARRIEQERTEKAEKADDENVRQIGERRKR